jgi:hypothetical protein
MRNANPDAAAISPTERRSPSARAHAAKAAEAVSHDLSNTREDYSIDGSLSVEISATGA